MSDENEELLKIAAFGEQVQSFITSDIGEFILTKAFTESEMALAELAQCDPVNSAEIRRLQNIVQRASSLKLWLEGAVNEGLQALQILEDRG